MQVDISGTVYSRCFCCRIELKDQTEAPNIEMFRRCLNLIVVTSRDTSLLMCAACIGFVNEVMRFRDMVLASQTRLHGFLKVTENYCSSFDVLPLNNFKSTPEIIQDEVKVKLEKSPENLDPAFVWPEDGVVDNISDDQTSLKNETDDERFSRKEIKSEDVNIECEEKTKTKRKRLKNDKTRIKRKRLIKSESESDTPISQIKEKKSQQTQKKDPKPTLSPADLSQLRSIIGENNKIRSNIILLLKHSTIIPFLNNFKSPYKCFYCDNQYIPFRELKEHTETQHVNICEDTVKKVLRKLPEYIVTADVSRIKCKLCNEQFQTIENITEHLTNIHNKIYNETDKKPSHGIIGFDLSKDILQCHVCEKQFPFFKNLLVHMNEHGSFVCYICGKTFFSERKYRSHVSKHDKSEATCKICGKTFVSKSAMSHHNRKEHIKSKIKCLKCPETFHFEHYAQRLDHMEKVHGIKKPIFKCQICGKECKTSGILSSHINLTHKRSKEYRCDVCSYATFNNSHFKNHIKTHTGVKNHECQYCKKRFLKMYSLTRHLMMHKNDKRFTCPLCDASFIQKVNMKSHLRHRHKDFDLSKL